MKTLESLSIKKVVNLGKLCGFLVANEDIPLHFFKVIDFSASKLNKPTQLFLHLMLQACVELAPDADQLRLLFLKGLKDEELKHETFVKGLQKFILGKFYKRMMKQHEESKMPKQLQAKIMSLFKSLKAIQAGGPGARN